MNRRTKLVNSTDELLRAAAEKDVSQIIINANLDDVPSIKLLAGQSLRSNSEQYLTLTFRENTDGLQLSSDNSVSGLLWVVKTTSGRAGVYSQQIEHTPLSNKVGFSAVK
jgi:hypothetical protein